MRKLFPLVMLTFFALLAIPQNPPAHVGKLADGGFLLTTGWRTAPEGIQIPFPQDTFPMNLAWHPDGKNLFILSSGYKPPSVLILDTSDLKTALRVALPDAWLGLAINKAGDRFYVPQANLGSVQEFSFNAGQDLSRCAAFNCSPGLRRVHVSTRAYSLRRTISATPHSLRTANGSMWPICRTTWFMPSSFPRAT